MEPKMKEDGMRRLIYAKLCQKIVVELNYTPFIHKMRLLRVQNGMKLLFKLPLCGFIHMKISINRTTIRKDVLNER